MTAQAESGSDPGVSGSSRIGSGRAGPVRLKLRAAVLEARRANRMTAEHEVRALLADRYAAIVDQAARDGEARALLIAGDKLLELLDTLPVRTAGGGDDDSGDDRGRLLTVLDGGPEVGDTANA